MERIRIPTKGLQLRIKYYAKNNETEHQEPGEASTHRKDNTQQRSALDGPIGISDYRRGENRRAILALHMGRGLSPYSIWYKGILWDRVDATEYIIEETGAANEPPAIEVLDSSPGATAEQELYPPLLILQWRGVDGVDRYQIQEKVFGTWTTRHTVLETGLGYYQYKTPALADVTLAKWRVRAIDEWDNPSAALNFDAFIVSNPEPPAITMTYDSGTGLVTIASA